MKTNMKFTHSCIKVGTCAAFLLLAGVRSDAQVLTYFNMGQNGPTDTSPDLTVGDLTNFGGLNTFNTSSTLSWASAPVLSVTFDVLTPDVATATNNGSYFTFDVTVGGGVADLDLTSLSFDGARGGAAPPRGYAIFATTPTTTFEEIQGETAFATQRYAWDPQSIDLTGFASLQNLAAGDVVTFAFAAYSQAAGNSVDFDSIVLSGTGATPVPEPGTASLLGLGVFALFGLRRRQPAK